MAEKPLTRADAQKHIDQIEVFQQELIDLQSQQVLTLSDQQHIALKNHYHQLKADYSTLFDIDPSPDVKQLTLGMKLTSFLGALAMASSLFFLFYQFWGYISMPLQVGILATSPALLFALTIMLAAQPKSLYFAKIAGLMCLSCFILNVSMLGQIFNIAPSPTACLLWATLGFVLAYACNAKLLLVISILLLCSFMSMHIGSWQGIYWMNFAERPENVLIPALLLFFLPLMVNQRRFDEFTQLYRITGMLLLFIPLLFLSNWGGGSYLSYSIEVVEGIYQLVGFALSAAGIWLGIKYRWQEVINTAAAFFVLFLFNKFFDWWWDWMPKYVFFFLLGLSAILALMIFKRLRLNHLQSAKINREATQ